MISGQVRRSAKPVIYTMGACQTGKTKVVSKYLNRGINPNWVVDEKGRTGLHYAASRGFGDIVQLLVEHTADVNARDKQNTTALYPAAQKGHRDVVEILLKNGADQLDESLATALKHEHYEVAELIAGAGACLSNLIAKAVESWSETAVCFLLKRRADVNYRAHENSLSPLHLAARKGRVAVVDLLICEGAKVFCVGEKYLHPSQHAPIIEVTPLSLALSHKQSEVVERLMQENEKGSHWLDQELCIAARYNLKNAVKFLVMSGADVNWADNEGYTALTWAVIKRRSRCVQYLMSKGADIDAPDKCGLTPFYHLASRINRSVLANLIQYGANVHAKDSKGRPLICRAAQHGLLGKVKVLYDSGARLDDCDEELRTPLVLAAMERHDKVVRALCKRGANLNDLKDYMRSIKSEDPKRAEQLQVIYHEFYISRISKFSKKASRTTSKILERL